MPETRHYGFTLFGCLKQIFMYWNLSPNPHLMMLRDGKTFLWFGIIKLGKEIEGSDLRRD